MAAQEYRYDTEVVRLYYDYASSVVWFPDPIRYEQSGLSSALIADLQAWRRFHDEGLDHEQQWRSPDLPARARQVGRELAHRLGDELGSAFEVEYDVFSPAPARYSSPEPPTNTVAAAAFTARADAARVERAELAKLAAERDASGGSGVGWFAVMPGTGQLFVPPEQPEPPERPEQPEQPEQD
ncbi:hypothetical protein JOE59_002338 [Agromyces cerinus]|uniref:Uncharacterized protein n=1 Tax=Agromyces hippuratus TaxID=286438 RepID=A0A852WW04_9MICO|nr:MULTISPECIES: hypothetical protein [Agromyces]MBM7831633.1 hypothetical protein [Agromyces cerinus]NYG22522.1 hypothetical protein [Agromyces hippuratus]